MLKCKPVQNKKGDIPSLFYAIAVLFLTGFIIVFFSHFTFDIYDKLEDRLDGMGYSNTSADNAINTAQTWENSIWDYVFLSIAIAYFLSLLVLAFFSNINALFYFIYGIMASLGMIVAVALANLWEKLAEAQAMQTTIARFPITNLLLDNYFPIFVTVIILSVMVLLFGKFSGSRDGGGLG